MAGNWFSDAWANPKFKQFVSEAGQDLGYGLTQGSNFGNALSIATERTQRLQPQRDAYAKQQAEEAKRLESINQTAAFLREKGYTDLLAGVESGGMDMGAAWTEALRRGQPATATADWAKLNDGTLFNQRTGETMPLEGMEGGFVDPKAAFDNEKDLYAQYSAADPVKTYEVVKGGYERVRQSAALQNGAGDMGLIYGYMKMLDPGSVVRETEFAMAAQAGSYGEQIQGLVSRLVNGERLPDSVRQQFVQAADGIYQETAQNLSGINSQFEQRANSYRVDPTAFIRQPEQYQPIGTDWTDAGGGFRIREK